MRTGATHCAARVVIGLVIGGLVLAFASPAYAQMDRGRLQGRVTDPDGAPLPGVMVQATSPNLIGGQTTYSQADGVFRLLSLPPGDYVLRFELAGFRTVEVPGIVLRVGATLELNQRMDLSNVEEMITITADTPLIDVASPKIGEAFSGQELVGTPTATDVWAMINLTPGVRMMGFDVGGSHKSQQTSYSIFGMNDQHKIVYDGVETTEGSGGTGMYADFLSTQELTIVGAGHDVEMANGGMAMITTYKSGSNAFHGLFTLSYEDDSFVGDNVTDDLSNLGYTGNNNVLFYELHAELGGPVIKDKLWFFAAYNHFTIDTTVSGIEYTGETGTFDEGDFDTFTTKETFRAGDKGTFNAFYQWSRKFKPYRGLGAATPLESTFIQDSQSQAMKLDYQHVVNDRMYMSLKGGYYRLDWPGEANADYTVAPPRYDLATGDTSGAYFYTFDLDSTRPQFQYLTTYYIPDAGGSHDLKWGVEWQKETVASGSNGASGQVNYYDLGGAPYLFYAYDFGTPEGFGSEWGNDGQYNNKWSIYLQDNWSPTSRLTITGGLRYDNTTSGYNGGSRRPVLDYLFDDIDVAKTDVLTRGLWSPRVSASYSLNDNATTLVKGFWGLYPFNTTYVLGYYEDGSGDNYKYGIINDLNGNGLLDGPDEVAAILGSGGGAFTTVDDELKIPNTTEFGLTLEHQFWGESSVRASWVHKGTKDNYGLIRPSWEGAFNVPFSYTTNIQNYGQPPGEQVTLELYDIPAELADDDYVVTNLAEGNGDRKHDTLSLAFQKRFSGGDYAGTSFDYSWNDTWKYPYVSGGNLYTSEPFDSYYQAGQAYRDVPLKQDTTSWQFRAHGRYTLPLEFAVSGVVRAQSGFNYARTFSPVLPNAGLAYLWGEDLTNNRSESVWIVDLRAEKIFDIGNVDLSINADLFNLLNANPVTAFTGANGPNYGRVTGVLPPRTLMLGARVSF